MEGGMTFTVEHEKYGWAVVFILVFFNITGMMAFMAKKIFTWNSKAIRTFRWVHRIVAYVMYVLVNYTLYLGLTFHIDHLDIMDQYGMWITLNWTSMIAFIVLFEIVYRVIKS